jgi:hypothetical protein
MTATDYFVYGSNLVSWVVLIFVVVGLVQSRRELRQAQTDDAFIGWANWTIFSVTARDGTVYSGTLRELYNERVMEKTWVDPIAVSLWHADPDVHSDYVRDAERLQQASRGEATE